MPELLTIRSLTSRGSCEISAYINWKANVDLSQQRIESKIAAIRNELPAGVQITVEKMNPSILPVLSCGSCCPRALSGHSLLHLSLLKARESGANKDEGQGYSDDETECRPRCQCDIAIQFAFLRFWFGLTIVQFLAVEVGQY